MRNLTLLELDELYNLLEKLQQDDRVSKYMDDLKAIESIKKHIRLIPVKPYKIP